MSADALLSTASAANPYAAGFGMAAQALSGGPSSASGESTSSFDSSGWNVVFGGGNIDSKRADGGLPTELGQWLPYAAIFAGVLIVWRMTKKR
jgi:hypothetical protein